MSDGVRSLSLHPARGQRFTGAHLQRVLELSAFGAWLIRTQCTTLGVAPGIHVRAVFYRHGYLPRSKHGRGVVGEFTQDSRLIHVAIGFRHDIVEVYDTLAHEIRHYGQWCEFQLGHNFDPTHPSPKARFKTWPSTKSFVREIEDDAVKVAGKLSREYNTMRVVAERYDGYDGIYY